MNSSSQQMSLNAPSLGYLTPQRSQVAGPSNSATVYPPPLLQNSGCVRREDSQSANTREINRTRANNQSIGTGQDQLLTPPATQPSARSIAQRARRQREQMLRTRTPGNSILSEFLYYSTIFCVIYIIIQQDHVMSRLQLKALLKVGKVDNHEREVVKVEAIDGAIPSNQRTTMEFEQHPTPPSTQLNGQFINQRTDRQREQAQRAHTLQNVDDANTMAPSSQVISARSRAQRARREREQLQRAQAQQNNEGNTMLSIPTLPRLIFILQSKTQANSKMPDHHKQLPAKASISA
ncbi:hypothetical protein Hypma_005672 [Hypsizygus marmoreus]|uniref:Uncharacterized protein n=1 Tax=Hypsizygus marmoreus TaxID=39966 RepID=A0A369K1R6_HYPMA|nr:hypothetical protein Hypma_005672 [Hypsizygus marmoreus]